MLLCLIALDAIVLPMDLEAAWLSLGNLYRDGDAACLEWCDVDGRQDRRILSPVTVLSWSAQRGRLPPLQAAAETLASRIQSGSDGRARIAMDIPSSFDQLLDWMRQALMTELAGDSFGHVCGASRLTALPRSALARRRRRLALRATGTTDELPDNSEGSMRLMDALGQRGASGGNEVIEQIRHACRVDTAEPSASAQRRRMLRDLQALIPAAASAGHWTSLLLLWAIDLVKYGTRRKRPLSPNTIAPYIQSTIGRLWERLRHAAPDEVMDWQSAYLDVLSDPGIEPSQLNKVAASLTAFHEFIETVLDVAPLARALDPEVPVQAARANVVWPHEWHWILDQLAAGNAEDRLERQLEAAVAFLAGGCLRVQDLWHVHVFGAKVGDKTLVMAIDPMASAGDGKSPWARRPVEIQDARCHALQSGWLVRRLAEGALPRDLLFGDPDAPRRPWRPGATEFLLNQSLKAATGDPDIGSHALRHAFATLARAAMSERDQRKLDQLSAQAGHAATQTTLTHYVHLYEAPLREGLDRSIRRLRMTEAQACRLTGMQPGRIRKRWERRPGERVQLTWAALDECAAMVDMADVCDGLEFDVPRWPRPKARAAWSFDLVLKCLGDLSEGRSGEQVQLRQGISPDQRLALEVVIRAWRSLARSRLPEDDGAPEIRDLPWREAFCRTRQEKWRPLMTALLRLDTPQAVRPVCAAWQRMQKGRYLSLESGTSAIPLIEWLCDAGVEGGQLVVSYANSGSAGLEQAVLNIEAEFGALPQLREERPRRGRPTLYLSLRSKTCRPTPPSNAALSMAGFHALLFSAWVWCKLDGAADE